MGASGGGTIEEYVEARLLSSADIDILELNTPVNVKEGGANFELKPAIAQVVSAVRKVFSAPYWSLSPTPKTLWRWQKPAARQAMAFPHQYPAGYGH